MDAPELETLRAAVMGGHADTDVDHARGLASTALRMCARLAVPVAKVGGPPGAFSAPSAPGPVVLEQLRARWPVAADGLARTISECHAQVAACVDAVLAAKGIAPPVTPPSPTARFVPAGARVTWDADLDGARSLSAADYNPDDWEYEPKDQRGTRIPMVIDDPTGAGRGSVLSAYIPAGMGAKGRSEAHPRVPAATPGQVVYVGYDLFVRSVSPGASAWGGDVVTQWAQGGYTPALEVKLDQRRLKLDGNGGGWHRDLGPVPVRQWVTVTLRAVMATNAADARLDAWLDRRQVLVDVRPSGAGTLYGGGHQPYPKHGLYAAPGRAGEVLFDNVWYGTPA